MVIQGFTDRYEQKLYLINDMGILREILELPEGGKKLLRHSCCAPCSGKVMEMVMVSGIQFSIFFYNPNQKGI